jgi:AraC family transcriptional regulator of adaptative response/methylated-DNA-[protein]-cysteine methyltransferase
MVVRACKLMEELAEPLTLDDLARAVGSSASHLHRLFKEILGVTPKAYGATLRMHRVRDGLAEGAPVTQTIYDAGFNSSSRFYENSSRILGMTAGKFKNGGQGTRIRFAVGDSFLGKVLVAATDRGICAIDLGDSDEILIRDLRARFPQADLSRGDPEFAGWVGKVAAFIDAPAKGLDLPLDVQGTAFQRRVWSALHAIPPGSVRSYTEIAGKIGKPNAVRAVAHACASNRIAVAVPCHRVLRRDGGLGGYRWGIERKRALLDREAAEPVDG